MPYLVLFRLRVLMIFFVLYSITFCSFFDEKSNKEAFFTLMTYNTQTFFDAVEDGCEFAAFRGSKSQWSAQKYRMRLERLVETVQQMGEKLSGVPTVPDIVVLQEIENARIIEDFCKKLTIEACYPYAVCAPAPENQAFTTAVLSKYPIENYYIHFLHTENTVPVRPLVEVLINVGTKENKKLLNLFSVHWKSKAREKQHEHIRTLQEKQLMQKIRTQQAQRSHIPFIICGDFNQTIEECVDLQKMAVCWNMESYCDAVENGMQPAGSYYFRNVWEKIDHIFYAEKKDHHAGIELKTFILPYESPVVKNGIPFCYNVLNGSGYSDHLPLGIQFSL